jgi:hypothetical protein
VSRKIIRCGLNKEDVERAIKELKAYKQYFLKKEKELLKGLAEIGFKEASVRFTSVVYDGTNDVSVTWDETNKGCVIVAEGQAVAFIEFGAGVYYNGSEPYPNPRPQGIVGIGEYGKGMGKRRAWGYKNENDELVITRGNPAAMPMWYASEEIKKSVLRVAKEVFG